VLTALQGTIQSPHHQFYEGVFLENQALAK
jgi:hypothetical protein